MYQGFDFRILHASYRSNDRAEEEDQNTRERKREKKERKRESTRWSRDEPRGEEWPTAMKILTGIPGPELSLSLSVSLRSEAARSFFFFFFPFSLLFLFASLFPIIPFPSSLSPRKRFTEAIPATVICTPANVSRGITYALPLLTLIVT